MSGVIDADGTQWEHCCACKGLFKMKNLGYQKPTAEFKYGRDLCITCVDKGIRSGEIKFEEVQPAETWQVTEVTEV